MSDAPEPLHRRRSKRRAGAEVDWSDDLNRYSALLENVPADDPRRPLMKAHFDQLVERVYGPSSALDLHLEGPGVEGHTTDARPLAAFLRALDEVVKHVTRSVGRLGFVKESLRVTPAVGSVRLVVEPPETVTTGGFVTGRAEHVEVLGLRRLVSLMNLAQAQIGFDSAQLNAALYDLSPGARDALAKFAKVTRESTYELRGVWVDARHGESVVRLSLSAASRLERAAGEAVQRVEQQTVVGVVDGWEWSSSTVHFVPRIGRPFRASVPAQLATQVASLIATRNVQVQARFAVLTTFKSGSNRPGGRGYSLEEIEQVVEPRHGDNAP